MLEYHFLHLPLRPCISLGGNVEWLHWVVMSAMRAFLLSIICDGLGPDFNLLTRAPIHPLQAIISPLSIHDNVYDPEARISCLYMIMYMTLKPESVCPVKTGSCRDFLPYEGLSSSDGIPYHK